MDNLNNIPSVGNWGDAASKLNDNFNKIKQAVTTVENTSKNNKGYFSSLASLNTAFPSPRTGQTAYVYGEASSTKYYIYNAVNGAWVTSSVEAPSVGVAIQEYTKSGGSSKTTKQVEDEIVQLAGAVSGIQFNISGRLQYDGTFQSSSSGLFRTDFVDISKTKEVSVLGYSSDNNPPDSNGTACLAFYDAQMNFMSSIYGDENNYVLQNVEVPENAYYCVACGHPERSFLLAANFTEVKEEIAGLKKDTIAYKGGSITFNAQSGYIDNDTGEVISSTVSSYAIIDVTNLTRVDYNASRFAANAGYLFKNESGTIIQTERTTVAQREQVDVPEGATQMYISWKPEPEHGHIQQVSGYVGITSSEKFVEIDTHLTEGISDLQKQIDVLKNGYIDFSDAILNDTYIINATNGNYIIAGTTQAATEDYLYCKGAKTIELSVITGSSPSTKSGIAFYDENYNYITGHIRPLSDTASRLMKVYIVPENASFFRTSYFNSENRLIYGEFECRVNYTEPFDFDLDTASINLNELLSYEKLSGYIDNDTGNTVSSSISYHVVINVVDLTSITFQTSQYAANAGYLFKDEGGVIINAVHTTTKEVVTVDVPENAVEFYLSWKYSDDDTQQIYIKQGTTIPDKFDEVDKALQELGSGDTTKRRYYVMGNPDVIVTEAPSSGQISVLPDLYAVYDNLVATYPNFVSKEELGTDEWDNMIYCYTFKKNNPQQRGTGFSAIDWDNNVANMTVLITSGIHGGEKRATTSTSRMAELLCSSEDATIKYIRNNATVKIIPCLNPSGFIANTRNNGNGVDLNRDFIARTQRETNICCDFIDANADNAVGMIDCHNFGVTGMYALFVMRQDLVEFRQICLPIGIALEDNWKNFLPDIGKPYIDPTNANATTMKDYMFEKGIPGLSVESPALNSIASEQNSIKMAVDMYFNLIVAFIRNNS